MGVPKAEDGVGVQSRSLPFASSAVAAVEGDLVHLGRGAKTMIIKWQSSWPS
jgi:hypothetical protein